MLSPPWASSPDQSPSWDPEDGGPEQRPESKAGTGCPRLITHTLQKAPGPIYSTALKNLPSPSHLCSSHVSVASNTLSLLRSN